MEIFEFSLQSANPFVNALIEKSLDTITYFDYDIHQEDVYEKRRTDLLKRSFNRAELSSYLKSYNEKFQAPATMNNIERLLDKSSTVVVGGQQAGLLTGPLYTIHKVISILALAKQQEEKLGSPVIPVFWIAGEDHDFDEINHVYIQKNGRIKKKAISQRIMDKRSVAFAELDHTACKKWVNEVIQSFGETQFTKGLLEKLTMYMEKSATYTEFFEWLVMDLFGSEGLVLIQSADSALREFEIDYFSSLIEKNDRISRGVREQQQLMTENGFSPIIETAFDSANLFYELDHERLLMQRLESGHYADKEKRVCFSKQEFLNELATHPVRFSNNVVTRPMMQEMVLPTLAFIAGPGELAYWAELKKAFEAIELKMPPVVPRLNITLLERSIETDLRDIEVGLHTALEADLQQLKEEWMAGHREIDIDALTGQAVMEMKMIHEELVRKIIPDYPVMEQYAKKNIHFIAGQMDLLRKETKKNIERKHDHILSKFDRVEQSIKPEGSPQERIWNIYYYLNKYGSQFPQNLAGLSYSFNNQHKVVKI
ncbi:bacillithiol biosynthesis cysteine-adding enzyme BshC [Bacillus sp. FJAT-42376]|uniref:bacillithiol biosynthesis cysteine-adding enzyme BshC n=1 Tax=Bacillus sp. FJAT-42376 TaxID=2014076 RepID=UPI000F4EFB07|nr:bacillithiol biosynthesis cysteine-adding enzyme BshC [Bacillus sp. FJAT-42376]AZB42831.1 bacillithiol biosynthesis cysteine-adding enzyme BshC [Bacillus sp. FJAT-42376]